MERCGAGLEHRSAKIGRHVAEIGDVECADLQAPSTTTRETDVSLKIPYFIIFSKALLCPWECLFLYACLVVSMFFLFRDCGRRERSAIMAAKSTSGSSSDEGEDYDEEESSRDEEFIPPPEKVCRVVGERLKINTKLQVISCF